LSDWPLHRSFHTPLVAQPRYFAERFWPGFLFVLTAVSSFVQHEPAPYDFLLMGGMLIFLFSGPRVPNALAWPAVSILLLFIGYALGAMSAAYQEDAFAYMRTSAYLSVSLLFFAALVWRAPERMVPAIMAGLVVSSAIAAAIGIAAYFGAIPNSDIYALYGRATGPFKDPNVFGPSLILPALYLANRLVAYPKREMIWSLPLLLLLLLGLFLSFSRGAWANFLVAALIFAAYAYRHATARVRRRIIGFGFTIVVVAAVGIVWALTVPAVSHLFAQRFAVQTYDTAEGGRFDSALGALETALSYPLGIGPDQWPHVSSSSLMPHDIYVNVFVSGGLISLAGFVALTVMTLWVGLRGLRRNPPMTGVLIAAVATFAGHALEGFIIDSNHWRHLYVAMGLIWGLALAADFRNAQSALAARFAPVLSWKERQPATGERNDPRPFQ
jgi:O-Antigen ligase